MSKRPEADRNLADFQAWQDHQYDPGYLGIVSPFRGRFRPSHLLRPAGYALLLSGIVMLVATLFLLIASLMRSVESFLAEGQAILFLGALSMSQLLVAMQLLKEPRASDAQAKEQRSKRYRMHRRR